MALSSVILVGDFRQMFVVEPVGEGHVLVVPAVVSGIVAADEEDRRAAWIEHIQDAVRVALSPARGPPQHDLGFDADPGFDIDQTPAFDLTEPEPVPDFD